MITKTDVHATNSLIAPTITTGFAHMENGDIIAKNSLRIGYEYDNTTNTYKNIKFAVDGNDGSFKAAGDKFAVSGSGAITADSLTLSENYNVKTNIEDAKDRITTVEGDLNTNRAGLNTLKDRVDGHDTDIGALKTKTEGITRGTDGNSTTVEDVNFKEGAVSGVKSINGDIEFDKAGTNTKVWVNGAVAAEGVAANNITANSSLTVGNATDYVHMSEAGIAVSGRLYSSLDPNDANLKSVSVAEMANTRDNTKKISYTANSTKIDSDVIINEGEKNQVKITKAEGIVVGLNSTVVGSDGVYAGGHTEATAKAVLGADGSIKGAGDGAGNYKFKVTSDGDVFSSSVTANLGGFNHVQINNGLTVGAAGGTNVAIGGGGIIATNGIDTVNVGNGAIVATGDIQGKDITATGNLSVAGTSTFTGKTTFSGGIKTDTIEEVTADKGVTVDGVLLKDGGVNASAMSVTGATGSLNVKDIGGTSTMIYTTKADGTNTIWIDPATGNISTNGTLQVGGGVAGTKPSVTIDGTTGSIKVGQNDTEKFAVDGTTGNVKTEGSLEVASNATVGGNIKGQSLNIGGTGGEFTVDTLGNVKANGITTSDTTTNKIGGVTLAGSDIKAKDLNLTGTLTAAKYNATDIEATNSIKVGTTTMTDGKLDLGSNGTVDFGTNELTDVQVGNINNVIRTGGVVQAADGSVIGGVSFSAKDITGVKDLTATGKVTAATISDGTASLSGGALTGLASVKIGGNTDIDSTGIKTNKLSVGSGLNATTIDEANGVVSAKGEIGAVKFIGSGKLDNVTAIDGVSVAQNSGTSAGGLTFGGNAIIGATGIPFQSTGFKVDDDGDVEGKTFATAADGTGNRSTLASGSLTIDANNTWTKDVGIIASNVKVGSNELKNDGLYVGTNTTVKDGVLTVGAGNTWSMTNGITASKAVISGVTIGETEGKAVFNKAAKATTIDGDKITTGTITADELNVDKISLGKGTDKNITIGSNGDVTTKGDVTVTGADDDTTVIDGAKATFGKDAANQTTIDKGKISAKAKSTTNQIAEFGFDENGLTVSGQNAAGQKSSFSFNAKTGANTFTGQDGTTTTINGSAITSSKATGDTGVLDGSNLTLKKGVNSTVMTAGGVTFTGKQGASTQHGDTTTIDGGIITTDTLKVQRIQLGEKIVDERTGKEIGSGVTLAADGGFTAAGGNFKVVGGATGSRGSITNVVGDDNSGKTVFETNQQGANMSFKKGDVKSEVAVADGKAEMAVGANAAVTTTDGKVEIKGGTQTVTTTDAGTVFDNGSSAVRPGGVTTTTINGNEITTGKITTDQLVITGQGNAHGNGSIAFGGNGTIKSDINDGTTNGKNTSFETTLDGVNTKVTDGKITTENNVSAAGNSNTVTNGDNKKSEFNQDLTSIGGVVTNGEIKVAQKLDGATGLLTNEVTDANGSSKLEQSGTGLTYTDSANTGNATRINSSDVSIGSATNDKDRINLSDLGQIDDLDQEIRDNEVYKKNETAVGGINAEAAIRREEVARLDGRINDVNDRVNKVGAMAAAIASLKSIGYDPQAPSEFSIGLGQYKGETGVAMGFFHYPNKNFMINVSLSTAGGETMGGIGATQRFGHKSPQKLLEEQREAQAKKELAAAEKYQAAAKLAKEAQERAEYAAKLARQAQVSADNAKAAADATQAKHFG